MRRQINMSQMKEQNKTPEKEQNKMKTSNLADLEFKTLVIKMLNKFRGRLDVLSENLKSSKRKAVSYLQGHSHKIFNQLLH